MNTCINPRFMLAFALCAASLQGPIACGPQDIPLELRTRTRVATGEPSYPKGSSLEAFVNSHHEAIDDDHAPIPIFVISYNRLTWLKRTLYALNHAIARPIDIIIHDNGSDFPELVDYLAQLEQQGITVVRNPPITHEAELNSIGTTIAKWYLTHDAPYYAITDPDVELDIHDGAILDVYIALLRAHPDIDVVGPYLRIDDLPDHYPLKEGTIRNELEREANLPPTQEDVLGRTITSTRGGIDTTFGLYRKSFVFRRVNMGIQVYPPYAARHLDWYLDPNNLMPDQENYMRKANRITHSGGTWLREVMDKHE